MKKEILLLRNLICALILTYTAISLYSCKDNKGSNATADVQEQSINGADTLEINGQYRSIKGTAILCFLDIHTYAEFSTSEWLSEEEIKAFIKTLNIPSDKNLAFYYEGLRLPAYASVEAGNIHFDDAMPHTIAEAKQYQLETEEKTKEEQIAQERIERQDQKTIIGNWQYPNSDMVLTFCIYKEGERYYTGEIDRKTGEIKEQYEVVKISSRRYENRDNGDMPERFDILPNGDIRTRVYNPDVDGGTWVDMGTWYAIGY